MGRSRCCWLSWWTELALTEQAEMKTSGYAVGSLLTVADLPVAEVAAILAATDRIERMAGVDRVRMLAGRRIALLFYESSTRTRTSFELAAKSLGATTTLVSDPAFGALVVPHPVAYDVATPRIRAFSDDFRGIYPTLNIHGFAFRCVDAAPIDKPVLPSAKPSQAPSIDDAPPFALSA